MKLSLKMVIRSWKKFGKYKLQVISLLIFLLLWLSFSLANPRAFADFSIYASLMATLPFLGIPALALTYVLTCREMDLSFPSIMGLSAWLFTVTWSSTGSTFFALLSGLSAGLMAGLLNGLLVTKGRVPSLIATLGTMFFWRGVVMVGSGGFGKSLLALKETTPRNVLVGRIGEIPVQMLWMVAFAFIFWLILSRHKFGAHVSFTGDNPQAAILMGINVDRVKIIVFTILGFCAAFSGILICLALLSFWPGIGEGYLLLSYAAIVIGGTALFGGAGTIFGTFVGSHIMRWLETGILAAGISGYWTQLVAGLVVVVAVLFQGYLRWRH
jgi:simple sugar transport system permease protein